MNDVFSRVSNLKRPGLLVRAARHRAKTFRRDRHLPRLLQGHEAGLGPSANRHLIALEAALDEKRRSSAADYDVTHHIEVLSALMTEAQGQPPAPAAGQIT